MRTGGSHIVSETSVYRWSMCVFMSRFAMIYRRVTLWIATLGFGWCECSSQEHLGCWEQSGCCECQPGVVEPQVSYGELASWTVEPLNPRAADLWKWFVRDLPYVCAYASTIGLLIVGFGILVAFWSFDRGIATPLLNQGLGIRSWHWKILKICGLISGLVNLTIFAE